MNFFQKSKSNEDPLYVRIRDFKEYIENKNQIEVFWRIYRCYVQGKEKRFLDKAQKKGYFKQCWWEMVLTIGLLNVLYPRREIYKKNKEKGPDIIIKNSVNTSPKIYIEAIAPKEGESEYKLPKIKWDENCHNIPEVEFLLRLSTAFIEKYNKYKKYIKSNIICENEIYIIAISACNLNEYDSIMDYPCPAPLKFLFGAGYQVVSPKESFVRYRPQIMKGDIPVEMNYFLKNEYNGISAVLYSNAGILRCPNNPEETFVVIKNPLAKNPLPDKFLKDVTIGHLIKSLKR